MCTHRKCVFVLVNANDWRTTWRMTEKQQSKALSHTHTHAREESLPAPQRKKRKVFVFRKQLENCIAPCVCGSERAERVAPTDFLQPQIKIIKCVLQSMGVCVCHSHNRTPRSGLIAQLWLDFADSERNDTIWCGMMLGDGSNQGKWHNCTTKQSLPPWESQILGEWNSARKIRY